MKSIKLRSRTRSLSDTLLNFRTSRIMRRNFAGVMTRRGGFTVIFEALKRSS
jgi:hypothetical protein